MMRTLVITASIILLVQIAFELAIWVLPAELSDANRLTDADITTCWYIAGAAWLTVQFICAWIVVHQAVWGS